MSKGGKREGAGRKPAKPELKKTARSVKLPEWLWQWMDEQPATNRALLIEDALYRQHRLKPPIVTNKRQANTKFAK